jgi:AraC-like DNA-binding protein
MEASPTVNPTLVHDDMRYWRLTPDARLRPWVLCYFIVEPGTEARLIPPDGGQQLLLPDGYSELVFRMEGAFERWAVGDPGTRRVMSSSYLIGGRSHSVLTYSLSYLWLAGAKLHPHFLRGIIRTPLSEFRDSPLALSELNSRALLGLDDAVLNARSPEEVKERLDRFFLRALRDLEPADRMLSELLHRIRVSRGALSIMEWTRAAGVDARTLERHFCACMGMIPKQYARIVRFKHSYHRLVFGESRRCALKTHLDGFYDESHFNREFRKFMGVAPSARITGRMLPATTVSDHLLQGELSAEFLQDRRPAPL